MRDGETRASKTAQQLLDFSSSQSHLADITGPCSLLLTRRSQEDHREGLTVRRLHHDFKLQVVEALTCCVVCKNTPGCHISDKCKHWEKRSRIGQSGSAVIWFGDTHSPHHWHLVLQREYTLSETVFLLAVGGEEKEEFSAFGCSVSFI